jgi:putative tricarboxylic transport membrane protein
MKLNDAVFGFILLALGAAVLVVIQAYPKIPGQPVGPALFPGLIATGICVCGAILVVHGWLARREEPWLTWDDWVRSPRHVLGFAVLVGGVAFYIVAAEFLGFLIVAPIVLLALFLVLGVRPRNAVIIAVVATLLVHFAFYKGLRVPLPWGVLKGFAW